MKCQIKSELLHLISPAPLSDESMVSFLEAFLNNSIKIHHPCNIGHQLAPSKYPSALADLVIGSVNNGSGVYEMGSASSVIERDIVSWMLDRVGWNNDKALNPAGLLCSGGTIANLTALLAARNNVVPDAWEYGCPSNIVIIAPSVSHFSISRAAGIIGIGVNSVVSVGVDEIGRIKPSELEKVVSEQKREGKTIMAVIANACATPTGIYDDLVKVGGICRKNDIWFHIDGAHGMSAVITKKYRDYLNGVEFADSITWDAHKMLQTSSVCAAALFKSNHLIDNVFRQNASYISFDSNEEYPNQLRRTIECTKPSMGLKLLFNLLLLGEQQLAVNIEKLYDNTRFFYDLINKNSLFECLCEPQSNILCFRLKGVTGSLHKKLRSKIISDGRFYITEAEINEKIYFRITVMNQETSEDDINNLLQEMSNLANSFGGGNEFSY